jgi:transcriptional regulator NrdR family protein
MSGKIKCPQCGSWTEVIETRKIGKKDIVYRRRECGNGHRLVTHETFVKMIEHDSTKSNQNPTQKKT